MKTNWQDPQTSEIRSTHISGLQEIAGKIEDILDLQLEAETGVTLTEVYISETDRYRIYQAPAGKRNWAASPAPVIYKNGVQITSGFTIDYGGGAIILSPAATSTDVFTADFSRVKTDGGNRLDKYLTDAINVKAFGASGSTQTTTGDITAGSAVLTLAAAIDFKNGQGITVNHAGAACTLATPSAPTVTPTGTAGTTTYQYQIVALDGKGGCTAASAAGVTTTGNATLSATNYNALSWTAVSGATAYAVYGRVSGTMQLLAIVSGTSWNDKGTAAITPPSTLPSTPPASALADTLVTTISSGGGTTTLTLAVTATTTATAQEVGHDDTAAFLNAINATKNGSKIVFIPSGNYCISNTLIIDTAITILGAGAGENISTARTTIIKTQDVTACLLQTNYIQISGIYITQNFIGGTTHGIQIGDANYTAGNCRIEVNVTNMGGSGITLKAGHCNYINGYFHYNGIGVELNPIDTAVGTNANFINILNAVGNTKGILLNNSNGNKIFSILQANGTGIELISSIQNTIDTYNEGNTTGIKIDANSSGNHIIYLGDNIVQNNWVNLITQKSNNYIRQSGIIQNDVSLSSKIIIPFFYNSVTPNSSLIMNRIIPNIKNFIIPDLANVIKLTIQSSTAITAGTITANVLKNGVSIGKSVVLNTSNPQSNSVGFSNTLTSFDFTSNSQLSIQLVTSSDLAPSSLDITVDVMCRI